MNAFLAYADVADQSNPAIAIIVVSAGIVLLSAGLALAPIGIAWRRRHRQAETIVPLAMLWGLAAAGVSIYAYVTQTNWAKERLLRIESGYYDPQDNSGAPVLPWIPWLVLAIALILLIAWALRKSGATSSAGGTE